MIQSCCVSGQDMKDNTRIFPRQSLDDGRDDRGRDRFAGSNPHFSRRRIGQELDLPYSLAQFVKDRSASFDERAAIGGWLDALSAAVEEPGADCMLKVRDGLRNGGLGHTEAIGRLAHALSRQRLP